VAESAFQGGKDNATARGHTRKSDPPSNKEQVTGDKKHRCCLSAIKTNMRWITPGVKYFTTQTLLQLGNRPFGLLQLDQLLHSILQAQRLASSLLLLVPRPDVDRSVRHLVLTHDQDKVPSGDFGVEDLLLERFRRDVGFGKETLVPKLGGDLVGIVFL
jgi:hypothetical protein